MRVLAVTSLFPRPNARTHGIFIRHRLVALAAQGVEVRVLSPLPYVPPGPVPPRYAALRATPECSESEGLAVRHVRYPMVPKLGIRWQAAGYAWALRRAMRAEIDSFFPDVIDAHYLYPDACGVARVADEVSLPFACTARGSDVHVLGQVPYIRRQIQESLGKAAAVIAVSAGLADSMKAQRLYEGPIEVISNGIDPRQFRPGSRTDARERLGLPLDDKRLVCVGNLIPVHGQDLLLRGLARMDPSESCTVHLIGQGAFRERWEELASELGIADRVVFEGTVPHERIADWYLASNGSIQLSRSVGSPNAVLESIACGVPVLATDIPGMREAIAAPDQGLLVSPDPSIVATALAALLKMPPARSPVRNWSDVGREVADVLARVASRTRPAGSLS